MVIVLVVVEVVGRSGSDRRWCGGRNCGCGCTGRSSIGGRGGAGGRSDIGGMGGSGGRSGTGGCVHGGRAVVLWP